MIFIPTRYAPMAPMPPSPFATDEERAAYEDRRAAHLARIEALRREDAYEHRVMMILVGAFGLFAMAALFGCMVAVFGLKPTLIGTAVLTVAGYGIHLSAKRAADRAVPPIK